MDYHIQIVQGRARIQQPGYREVTYDLDEIHNVLLGVDPTNKLRLRVLRAARDMLVKNGLIGRSIPAFIAKKGVLLRR